MSYEPRKLRMRIRWNQTSGGDNSEVIDAIALTLAKLGNQYNWLLDSKLEIAKSKPAALLVMVEVVDASDPANIQFVMGTTMDFNAGFDGSRIIDKKPEDAVQDTVVCIHHLASELALRYFDLGN